MKWNFSCFFLAIHISSCSKQQNAQHWVNIGRSKFFCFVLQTNKKTSFDSSQNLQCQTVLFIVCHYLLTVSPGRGLSWPSITDIFASWSSLFSVCTVLRAESISRGPQASCAFKQSTDKNKANHPNSVMQRKLDANPNPNLLMSR